ncbi:MAG TPA: MarR family transcriptional regulator [Candidatus Binataceae bacterium]|nr:MarR family transcriptional regulator [Candidatus Binataceae bacterium]
MSSAQAPATSRRARTSALKRYVLDEQVGFLLRKAYQRHAAIFAASMIEDLTPTQFAAMAKLWEVGPCSQNRLGRLTAMDAATIKGIVDRLTRRGFTEARSERNDARLVMVQLTKLGRETIERAIPRGVKITRDTLALLPRDGRATFLDLLKKLS